MLNRIRTLLAALAVSFHLAAYAQEAGEADKAGPLFTAVVLIVMVLLVVVPLVWWWVRESRAKGDRDSGE